MYCATKLFPPPIKSGPHAPVCAITLKRDSPGRRKSSPFASTRGRMLAMATMVAPASSTQTILVDPPAHRRPFTGAAWPPRCPGTPLPKPTWDYCSYYHGDPEVGIFPSTATGPKEYSGDNDNDNNNSVMLPRRNYSTKRRCTLYRMQQVATGTAAGHNKNAKAQYNTGRPAI